MGGLQSRSGRGGEEKNSQLPPDYKFNQVSKATLILSHAHISAVTIELSRESHRYFQARVTLYGTMMAASSDTMKRFTAARRCNKIPHGSSASSLPEASHVSVVRHEKYFCLWQT
jgi:hypothetical protein